MTTITTHENLVDQFQHHYIHIDSKKLHYVSTGRGPVVLLIPGLATNHGTHGEM